MFTDGRSRRVVFLAHCLLNQNAISDGTAEVPAAHREILRLILDAQVAWLKCRARSCAVWGWTGEIPKEGTTSGGREHPHPPGHGKDGPRQKREALADLVAEQVQEYHKYGFQVLGIVGATAPPTAGWKPPRILTGRWRAGALLWMPSPSGWRRRGSPSPCLAEGSDGAAQKVATLL